MSAKRWRKLGGSRDKSTCAWMFPVLCRVVIYRHRSLDYGTLLRRKATRCKKATTHDLIWKRLLSDGTNQMKLYTWCLLVALQWHDACDTMTMTMTMTMRNNCRFPMAVEWRLLTMRTNPLPRNADVALLMATTLLMATMRCHWRLRDAVGVAETVTSSDD